MMNSSDVFFSTVLPQECTLFDPSENKYVGALLGAPPIDPMDFYFDLPAFNLSDFPGFLDDCQIPADPSASLEALSPPSLPPSPLSSAGDLSDVGSTDTQIQLLCLSPMGLSDPAPLANNEEVKPIKVDLEGFNYNPLTRKWVCSRCDGDFVSTHEARRHVKTAAKCTGTKVKCLRCGDHIHAAQWSRKRHFGSKKCQKKGRKSRGVTTYTVNNAFEEA